MVRFAHLAIGALLALSSIQQARADSYLHNPPGSNDRNREQNGNRDNANRLFDSQNNAAGGYPWRGDPNVQGAADELTYYPGSMLRIEWTVQHACGPDNNVECEVILQYACEDTMPSLRDGYPTGDIAAQDQAGYTQATFQSQGQNGDGTQQIPMPANVAGANGETFNNDLTDAELQQFYAGTTNAVSGGYIGAEFGMHESYAYYSQRGLGTERNQGLYIADRNLGGDSAIYTRQNNGGTRSGFEVAEERDYYPYWQPSPWKDIAVLTSDLDRCAYYQAHSQNVESKFYCQLPANAADGTLAPISELACQAVAGVWTEVPSHGLAAPDCVLHASSRDNHLGNTVVEGETAPTTAFYNWQIPADAASAGKQCVTRLRYNMSSTNYDAYANYYNPPRPMVDAAMNCQDTTGENGVAHCGNSLAVDGTLPLYQDPYVEVFAGLPYMGLNINTNQVGRTFQDRSHVFSIGTAMATQAIDGSGSCSTVWNLNVRGKRGNIVQAYPAVEYDYVPSTLDMDTDECVHVQFHNSDFNENNVAGNGADGTDASNIVQIQNQGGNIPVYGPKQSMFQTAELAQAFMMVGQNAAQCADIREDDNNDQDIDNCGKLNSRAYKFDVGGPIKFTVGEHEAINIRNNDFSNRSHKLKVNVSEKAVVGGPTNPGTGTGGIAGAAGGDAAAGGSNKGSSGGIIIGIGAAVAACAAGLVGYKKFSGRRGGSGGGLATPQFGQDIAQPQPAYQQQQSPFSSGVSGYNSNGYRTGYASNV